MDQVDQDLGDILGSDEARTHPAKDRYTFEQGDLCISRDALTTEVRKGDRLVYRLDAAKSQGEKERVCLIGDWTGEVHRIAERLRARSAHAVPSSSHDQ
jgi:hypothetical protein